MNMPQRSWSSKLLWILLSAVAILAILHLTMQYLNLEVFYQQNGLAYELSNRLDLDDESSIPTGYSLVLFLLISATAVLAAFLETGKAHKRLWKLFATSGILFSIDEASGIHEFLLQTLHVLFYKDAAPTGSNNAWLLVVPIILVVGVWLIWKMVKLLPLRTVALFAVAGITFLTGAIGIDLLISINERETFLNQGIMVAIEETLELLGASTALYALANYLEIKFHNRITTAIKHLKQTNATSK